VPAHTGAITHVGTGRSARQPADMAWRRRALEFIRRNPVTSSIASGATAGAVGDGAAQWFDSIRASEAPGASSARGFNWARWCGMTTFGCFCSAGMYRPFYILLDKHMGTAVTFRVVASKVLLDDGLFSPCVEIPALIAWTSTAEGEPVVNRIRREYWSTVAGAITFNIPITILNFTVVPPPFRVLVIDVSEVLRTTLLSYISHRSVPILLDI
jgi:hypothetical protein